MSLNVLPESSRDRSLGVSSVSGTDIWEVV